MTKAVPTTIRLRDVAVKIGSGITPDGGRESYVRHGVPLIRSQNVNHDRLLLDKVVHITDEQDQAMANTRVQSGDVLLNITGASIGRSCVVPHGFRRGNVNQHVCIIRCNGQVNPAFLQAYLASHRGQHQIMQLQAGGGRQGINFKEIGNIRLPNLSRKEQREVVNVLATTDRAIAGVEKLIAAKRSLKKGLAQQLLTGQRRLPGSSKPWGAKRLGNLVTLHFSGIDKKTHADEVPVRLCNYTDVYYNDGITSDMDFMQATASKSEIESLSLKQWDVVITKDSETPDDIGKPAVIMHDLPGVVCGYHLAILRPKNVDGLFLAQLLRLPRTRYELYRIANGVTRFGLGQSALRHLELTVPDQSEQARIAAVLGAADREIVLLEKKLAALRELKKGLMQKLLNPSDQTNRRGAEDAEKT